MNNAFKILKTLMHKKGITDTISCEWCHHTHQKGHWDSHYFVLTRYTDQHHCICENCESMLRRYDTVEKNEYKGVNKMDNNQISGMKKLNKVLNLSHSDGSIDFECDFCIKTNGNVLLISIDEDLIVVCMDCLNKVIGTHKQ